MPVQKPGRSKQDYGTPWELIGALQYRFGEFEIDLAATIENRKCRMFIPPELNSLKVDWGFHRERQCWLNPPFSAIGPWARKCVEYVRSGNGRGRIFFLTPASIGSNWFADYVFGNAYVIALGDRITFQGETAPYPKDCIVSIFGEGMTGFEVWKWAKMPRRFIHEDDWRQGP